jgi:hypothetical protein
MPTQPHPIDRPASLSLVAAFMLIVGFGVLALVVPLQPRSGSMQGVSTEATATDTVAEWGD